MTETTDEPKPYIVQVDDNFRYQDEDERYTLGAFASLDAAISACKEIVDKYLERALKPGMTATELYESYENYGEDPFILTPEMDGSVPFSAWDYAKAKAEVMCAEGATRH
jgi:hypothetical protein